ncbi:uncharacterized protein dnajc14 [Silurus meridionalis]|uniref:J domain-containing protein n=1 Tax=Silurus meridionalis TaxID=175797 RepID=A0A8T0AMM3_SILME|nr:uncharacterized protein dnajc14 [Silurus meridionalis]KAF7693066.1 hypothetical protein HF521_008382 [Silurus meridionalis]
MMDVVDDPEELSAGTCPDDGSASGEFCEEPVPSLSEEAETSRQVPEDPNSETGTSKQEEDSEKADECGCVRTNGGMEELGEDCVFDEVDDEKDGWRTNVAGKDTSGSRGKKGKQRKSGSVSGDQFSFWTSPSSFSSSTGASRHKQIRRRNHHHHNQGRLKRQTGFQVLAAFRDFLSVSVSPWSISCIHMVVDLIVSLTHHCGVVVESGAIALYDLGTLMLFKVTDVPGMKQDLKRAVDRTWSSGAALAAWVCKTTSTTRNALVSAFGLLSSLVFLCAWVVRSIVERLGGDRGRRWWLSLQNCWIMKKVVVITGRIRGWLWKLIRGSAEVTANLESPSRTEKSQPGQELERLLALAQIPEDELDPFNVLGVNTHATDSELKRAYRQLAVQVHPDKNKHPRAGEAFKVLRAAWDIVSNPETRREYELKRMAASELSKSMNEFLTKLQDDLKEAMNTMMCTKCEGKHKRFEMDREPHEARFCAECNKRHSAEEGDLWAESSMLGLKITYFAFMDSKVYDITEWAGCQRIGISPDTHRVPYHISFGSKSNSSSNRHRSPSGHAPAPGSPPDLQDFFSRIFQGAPGGDTSSNGGFFSPGSTPNYPGGGSSPPPPPPQPGFFPQRGETSESWSEGGKVQRRRKKARKPFQR